MRTCARSERVATALQLWVLYILRKNRLLCCRNHGVLLCALNCFEDLGCTYMRTLPHGQPALTMQLLDFMPLAGSSGL